MTPKYLIILGIAMIFGSSLVIAIICLQDFSYYRLFLLIANLVLIVGNLYAIRLNIKISKIIKSLEK